MVIKEKILTFFRANPEESDDEECQPNVIDVAKMEVEAAIEDMSIIHVDTDQYTVAVNNLQTLTNSYENLVKAESEMNKTHAEISQSKSKRKIDWGIVAPKIGGMVVYGLVTIAFLAFEREHPAAMRMVQAADKLVSPRI